MVLLAFQRMGPRTKKGKRRSKHYVVNWHVLGNTAWFSSTQTLKTLQFQVVQSKWSNSYAILGIGSDGARVTFPSSICLDGPFRNLSWESWRHLVNHLLWQKLKSICNQLQLSKENLQKSKSKGCAKEALKCSLLETLRRWGSKGS